MRCDVNDMTGIKTRSKSSSQFGQSEQFSGLLAIIEGIKKVEDHHITCDGGVANSGPGEAEAEVLL